MEIPRAAPARLGRYELIARLATGGMGEIFLARLEGAAGFEKLFVVKRILPHLADDPRFRGMLIAEARLASVMTHANICHVYELGETDGQLYIVMEYLEGITLLPLLRKISKETEVLDLGFIGGVIQQASDGLHYAHELKDRGGDVLGIVHRDVTPSNLFLTDAGVVKVLDFGIAKVKDASAHTQTGAVKGKYAYMSPEQLRGATVDRRCDVFALGVIVYEMLALRRLFQRKTDYLTFRAVMEQPIPDVRQFRPDCPDALAAAILQALDRDPDRRFTTARQLGGAVLDAIAPRSRPWTQGEISDFVARSFGHDLKDRSAQIVHAVRTAATRETMLLIDRFDAEPADDPDDTREFPPIDSAISETPSWGHHGPVANAEYTPSGEQHASMPELFALSDEPAPAPASPPPPIVVVNAKRSVVWPLAALAMVAITGGALYLVWTQMQNQQPMSVVITSGRGGQVTESGSNTVVAGPRRVDPSPPEPPPESGSGRSTKPEGKPEGEVRGKDPAARKRPTVDPYREVARTKQVDANRCTTKHGNPPPGTQILIAVARDGHPTSVTIVPSSVEATPLGSCIKNVFQTATFPRGEDHELTVTLVPPK